MERNDHNGSIVEQAMDWLWRLTKEKTQSTIRISEKKKNEAPAMRTGVRLGALTPCLALPCLIYTRGSVRPSVHLSTSHASLINILFGTLSLRRRLRLIIIFLNATWQPSRQICCLACPSVRLTHISKSNFNTLQKTSSLLLPCQACFFLR